MKTLPNFCLSFRDQAHKVWEDLWDAEKLGISRDEETITQDLLLSLAKQHRGRGLDIKTFSKAEESANGADWAFWFADYKGTGIGVRIQAKRLFGAEGRYKSLYHQSDKQRQESRGTSAPTPNQCETLLTHRDGLIPLYVFYNSKHLDVAKVFFPYDDLMYRRFCSPAVLRKDWGISAATATAIKNAEWGKKNRPGDFPMIPWHCLVCPCCWDERPADASLPSLIGYGLQKIYEYSADGDDGDWDYRPDLEISFEPTDNSPRWVGLVGEGISTELSLEEEMSRLGLKGVAVIEEVPE